MRHDIIAVKSVTVSATHFVRHFSQLKRNADQGPVYIENHGKPGWALVSAELLDTMIRGTVNDEARDAHQQLDALMDSLVARVLLLDFQLRLVRANPAARRHLDIGDAAMGSALSDLLSPAIANATSAAARRTRDSGTSEIFEADCTRYPGRAQRITTARVPRGISVILEDLGDPGAARDTEAQLGAVRAALAAVPQSGFGTLNLRGAIDRADASLAALSGAPLAQLAGARLGTLFDMGTRARVNDLVERAIDRGEAGSTVARLLAYGDRPVDSVVALAPRRDRQQIGGAAFVIFARPGDGSA